MRSGIQLIQVEIRVCVCIVVTVSEGANDACATAAVVLEDLFDGARTRRDRRHFHGHRITKRLEAMRVGLRDRSRIEVL